VTFQVPFKVVTFLMPHDAEHATLIKNNTAQS